MKKYIYLMIFIVTSSLLSCDDNFDTANDTIYKVKVLLNYSDKDNLMPQSGVKVRLTNSMGITFDTMTNADGLAEFDVPNGIYEATARERRVIKDNMLYNLHGLNSGIIVEANKRNDTVRIDMISSRSGQILIKELYNGGIIKDDGSGNFQMDKYVKLYNNSKEKAVLKNFCLGMVNPYNGHAPSNDYVNGKLSYADKGYIPAGCGIWYLPKDLVIEPYKEVVIALNGAINHTLTFTRSIDLSHADYCTYDPDDFDNTSYYPAPSENIPTENYFLAYKYGMGNAWPLSVSSPAFFIFTTKDITPESFASKQNYHYTAGREGNVSSCCAKVPTEWIIDAIEVFSTPEIAKSKKRLTPDIDAGYASLTNQQGFTSYRNVDKEMTEALEGNKDKLVYNYAYGTESSTDPSGIDAEASIKNGAIIIYQDTNNSTYDFHQRKQASLKD